MDIKESSLFCELTDEELKKIIDHALACGICEATLKIGGMFNTTYFIKTDKCGDIILSVGPINRHLLMPFERRCMETESMIFDELRRAGIPTSEVLKLDISKTIIDRDYMIIRYIQSCMLGEAQKQYGEQTVSALYEEFGRDVKRLHSIKSARFGRMQDVRDGGGFEKMSDFMRSEIEDWISVASCTDYYDEDDFSNIRQLYEKYADILDEVKEATLVHGDLGPNNVLIDNTSDTPKIAAIIDTERGFWGDGDFDIAMIGYMINDDFVRGYGDIYACDEHAKIRRRLYEILRRLFDCYVWGAEYNQYKNMEKWRDRVRIWVKELLELQI